MIDTIGPVDSVVEQAVFICPADCHIVLLCTVTCFPP
jgi:hypothetical protein